MASVFSKIVAGEIPCYKIAETDNCLAFLDVFPLAKGHTLVIPKKEIDYIFDIDDALFTELQLFSKKVSTAVRKAIPCQRIGVAVIGLEVPHAHIHLIPLNKVSDIDFSRPKLKLTPDEMKQIQQEIVSCL
ncbi:MAG TPA: HIT family protein [Bacteroidia bacterium]|jgi:histidine triad (HIT) family protein|nr:HIT family protein [Bacteroidia bacterium]